MGAEQQFAEHCARITKALDDYDRPAVKRHCIELQMFALTVDDPCPFGDAKKLLANLRRRRHFVDMQHIADALIQGGQRHVHVARQYAQALIDQGQLAMAIQELKTQLRKGIEQSSEEVEVRGLLGRAYKQLFVKSGAGTLRCGRYLAKAIDWYLDVYENDTSNTWHGINAVALLHRAGRDGIGLQKFAAPLDRATSIANDVLTHVEGLWAEGTASMWDSGTAAEACIALDRKDDAARWMERYVREPYADAFELAGTRRQLIEIWQLNSSAGIGALVLPVLESRLMSKSGSELTFDAQGLKAPAQAETKAALEAILGRDRYVNYKFMLRALQRAKSVAQIRDEADYGIGTGFLVRGAEICDSLDDALLLLTNNHVVSEDPYVTNPPALEPQDATVVFGPEQEYGVKKVLWSSPPNRLDAALLVLDGDLSDFEPVPIAKRLPLPDREQRVYIIGHPKGGPLSFSIHDNALIDHEGPTKGRPERHDVVRLHYRAPTEGGSSGSPVFNAKWDVIGLHHAGGTDMPKLNGQVGTHPANEGLWLQSIRAAIAACDPPISFP